MQVPSMVRMSVTSGAVAVILVMTSGAAQAFEVQFSGDNATGITGLDVGGTLYDVVFRFESAEDIYGPEPGNYDFNDVLSAKEARNAVSAALNSEPAVTNAGPDNAAKVRVGYGFENDIALNTPSLYVGSQWIMGADLDPVGYSVAATYADFTNPTPVEPATWGRIKALYGN